MPLDDVIRDRVSFVGGKVAGVDCPNCSFESGDVELEEHRLDPVECPSCGTTILTADQKAQLRHTGKL